MAVGPVGRVLGEPGAEQLDHAVVEGQHAVGLGLLPPPLDERGQPLGLLGGQVVALGGVVGEVVELPDVVVERGALLVAGDRLPAVDVHAPVAHHLEVLHACARLGSRPRRRRSV